MVTMVTAGLGTDGCHCCWSISSFLLSAAGIWEPQAQWQVLFWSPAISSPALRRPSSRCSTSSASHHFSIEARFSEATSPQPEVDRGVQLLLDMAILRHDDLLI